MKRNEARVQMLALALMAVFAVLCLDLEPVQAVIHDYGLGSDDAVAEAEPAPAMRSLEGPSLAVGGEAPAAPASSCCPRPEVIAVPTSTPRPATKGAKWLAAPQAMLHKQPLITSMFPVEAKRWSSLEAAAHDLELSAAQRVSWGRTIEDARRDMDDLRHVPTAEGASWHDVVAAARPQHAGDPSGTLGLGQAMATFFTSELNGGETFATARHRILTSYKDRLRADLQPAQVETFQAYDVEPLLEGAQVVVVAPLRLGVTHGRLVRILRRKA
ncbi:MAG: hypothetical protein P1V36_11805 [Planctomycetota bacterium]|nr:hypothetical protein [Planctomycetota bacterium]